MTRNEVKFMKGLEKLSKETNVAIFSSGSEGIWLGRVYGKKDEEYDTFSNLDGPTIICWNTEENREGE